MNNGDTVKTLLLNALNNKPLTANHKALIVLISLIALSDTNGIVTDIQDFSISELEYLESEDYIVIDRLNNFITISNLYVDGEYNSFMQAVRPYERRFGELSPRLRKQFFSRYTLYGDYVFKAGIEVCLKAGVRNFRYLYKTLSNLQTSIENEDKAPEDQIPTGYRKNLRIVGED